MQGRQAETRHRPSLLLWWNDDIQFDDFRLTEATNTLRHHLSTLMGAHDEHPADQFQRPP
jgi:hypothetical protein